MTTTDSIDPADLSLAELRERRQELQAEDDVVSYARRVAQARLDLVNSEIAHRESHSGEMLRDELKSVLSRHLTGGPARPPRPTEDLSDHPLALELEAVCAEKGFGRLEDLNNAELTALSEAITEFESRVSSDRRDRYDRLDALSAELVRRYREGEADVDSLLA